jgi:hypothetical protein
MSIWHGSWNGPGHPSLRGMDGGSHCDLPAWARVTRQGDAQLRRSSSLEELPVVKLRASPRISPQEVSRYGPVSSRSVRHSSHNSARRCSVPDAPMRAEFRDIDPQLAALLERDRLPVCPSTLAAGYSVRRATPEAGKRPLLIALGPEHCGHDLPLPSLSPRAQVGQQSETLPGFQLDLTPL